MNFLSSKLFEQDNIGNLLVINLVLYALFSQHIIKKSIGINKIVDINKITR